MLFPGFFLRRFPKTFIHGFSQKFLPDMFPQNQKYQVTTSRIDKHLLSGTTLAPVVSSTTNQEKGTSALHCSLYNLAPPPLLSIMRNPLLLLLPLITRIMHHLFCLFSEAHRPAFIHTKVQYQMSLNCQSPSLHKYQLKCRLWLFSTHIRPLILLNN